MQLEEELIDIGKIIKPHGLDGTLKANLDLSTLKFLEERTIYLNNQWSYKIKESKVFKQGFLLKLDKISSWEQAKVLTGKIVSVKRSQIKNLNQNEFLIRDLLGLEAVEEQSGARIGYICDLQVIPGNPLLKIALNQENRSFLLPFNQEFLGQIDLSKKQIQLKNWQWFLI